MRSAGIVAVIALSLAACSNPDSRRGNDAADRAAAKRELERDCRRAQEMGQRDPRCPQPEDLGATGSRPPALPQLPPPPAVGLPPGG